MGTKFDTEVLIIGAGIAGLSAAERLRKAGIDTIVLEASKHVGGRIRDVMHWVGGRAQYPISYGAELVHGNPKSHPIWSEVRKQYPKLHSFEVGTDGQTIIGKNILHDARERIPKSAGLVIELRKLVNAHFVRSDEDMMVKKFLDTLPEDSRVKTVSQEFLDGVLANEYGNGIHHLPIATLLEPDSYTGPNFKFQKGFSGLVDRMLKNITDVLRTNAAALFVQWQKHDTQVQLINGTVLRALQIIDTLPVGVLQQKILKYDPGLPPWKQAAINLIMPAPVTKVIMEFKEQFWKTNAEFLRGDTMQLVWAPLRNISPKAPFLTALMGGTKAEHYGSMSSGYAARMVGEAVERAYDIEPGKYYKGGTRVAWHNERWIRTGYSHPRLHAPRNVRERLRAPIDDTLFFAGEATSTDYPATVTGAIETGWMAADEIIANRKKT